MYLCTSTKCNTTILYPDVFCILTANHFCRNFIHFRRARVRPVSIIVAKRFSVCALNERALFEIAESWYDTCRGIHTPVVQTSRFRRVGRTALRVRTVRRRIEVEDERINSVGRLAATGDHRSWSWAVERTLTMVAVHYIIGWSRGVVSAANRWPFRANFATRVRTGGNGVAERGGRCGWVGVRRWTTGCVSLRRHFGQLCDQR